MPYCVCTGQGGSSLTYFAYFLFSPWPPVVYNGVAYVGDDALEGVVMDYSSKWVRVAVPQSVAGQLREGPWRLDQYANPTAHERCATVCPGAAAVLASVVCVTAVAAAVGLNN